MGPYPHRHHITFLGQWREPGGGGTAQADKSQLWGLGCAHQIHSPKDKGSLSGPNDTTRNHLLMMWPVPGQLPGLHHSPVKPGVRAASILARASLLRLSSNLSGRRWTLKIDDLPLMSGGPERERHRWPGRGHLQLLHQGQEYPPLHVCTAHLTTQPGPEFPMAEMTHRSHPFSSPTHETPSSPWGLQSTQLNPQDGCSGSRGPGQD